VAAVESTHSSLPLTKGKGEKAIWGRGSPSQKREWCSTLEGFGDEFYVSDGLAGGCEEGGKEAGEMKKRGTE